MIHVTPVAGNLSLRRKMRMLATKAGVGLLVFALVLAGCASSKNQTDSDAGGHSAQTVHVYDEANLPASAFETVGEVTGAACREDVYDSSPTREEGVEALKRRAERQGGNALINVRCRRGEGTDDCPGAYRCTGEAVRVVSVESLPRMSQRSGAEGLGEGDGQTGTGWVIAPGRVVTSYQLVQDRSEFILSVSDTTVSAELVATDEVHNLALLRPTRVSLLPPSIPLAQDSATTGMSVFTVGYPDAKTEGADLRTATGIVSAQSGALGDGRVYRTTVPSSSKRGGAPLLNRRGQVVGVLIPTSQEQGLSQSGASTEPISYVIKIRHKKPILAPAPDRAQPRPGCVGTCVRATCICSQSVLPPSPSGAGGPLRSSRDGSVRNRPGTEGMQSCGQWGDLGKSELESQ